ncbi:uncharacterized protein LOC126700705 [Quercus robur]|uniref:uncharacterized protein LOC126700705 n=1 Tax=Quercus robur TaxID=38942 RepID=UPI0021638050|nr:uncharacterized protein LOC126700705 [Quercus robur]
MGLSEHLQVNKYWLWFEKCVGAIDGTQFTYVHAGWEGSANDSRVLEEAISDRKHGFPWPPTGDDTQSEEGESNSEGNDNGNTGALTSSATQRHVMEMLDEAKKRMVQFRGDITDTMWADYVAHGH